jgi:putative ABC transport system substrate-binding protein
MRFKQIRRRAFIAGLAASMAARGASARSSRRRRLGVLLVGTPESRAAQLADYARWLEELGWTSANLDLEYRWVSGNPQDLRREAAELAGHSPDVIMAQSNNAVAMMRQVAPSIPTVFVMVADPVGNGFVNSFARPGGTVTGFSNFDASMGGKWLEVLKEMVPAITTVGVLTTRGQAMHEKLWHSVEAAAPVLNVRLQRLELRSADDIPRAFAALPSAGGAGMIVLPHLVTASNRKAIIELAARQRVPAVYGVRFYANDGGLISYGVDSQDLFRRGFGYVDRILRGAKPSDLPVQAPVKFELVINLKTATALGIKVPPMLLARADDVIE